MILILDNYDSFTHNLARYFRELGCEVNVVRNDQITLSEIEELSPAALVVSPGPCTPDDAGISLQAIKHFATRTAAPVPVLGVCLGHQAIGQVFGGRVVRAANVMHGKSSMVQHNQHGLFQGIASPLRVVRYHSLVLEPQSLPEELQVTAWCNQDKKQSAVYPADTNAEIMAIQHRELPIFGVQFHPESVLSEAGHPLLDNFINFIFPAPLRNQSSKERLPA